MKPDGAKRYSSKNVSATRHVPASMISRQLRQRARPVFARSAPLTRGSLRWAMPFSAVGIRAVTAGSALARAISRNGSGRLSAAHGTWNQSVISPSPNAFGCRSPKRSSPLSIFWSQPRHFARALVAGSITCGIDADYRGGPARGRPAPRCARVRRTRASVGRPDGFHVLPRYYSRAYHAPRSSSDGRGETVGRTIRSPFEE